MKTKLFFLLQLAAFVNASSRSRYNHGLLRTHEELKQTNSFDCMFNICENDPHYPEEAVRSIVNKHNSFHSFLTGRVIEPVQGVSVFMRNNENVKPFCKTMDVQVAPKMMMDVDNVRRHIVNVKNHSQILKYQRCNLEGGDECFKETILDIKTKCVQMYNNIKLVTVDVNDGFLEYRTFRIPTTCVCTYVRQFA